MRDRAMQALHKLALEPVAETLADWNSYGFRPERSTADAIAKLFTVLSHKGSADWVLEGDIKGCFDHISHEWMLHNIHTDTQVLAKWLGAGYVDKGRLFATEAGTPQGGIISPLLANQVLDGLEEELGNRYGRAHGLKRHKHHLAAKNKVHFVRYADDFVITGCSRELLENEIKPLVRDFLALRGLTLSEEKTKVTHVGEGFDFLGQNIRKYHHGTPKEKLLIKPSKKNVKAFLEEVRMTIRKHRTSPQHLLIKALNPKIRGWANYHQHVVSKDTYNRVDKETWRALWRWAKRRHPMKPRRWIISRYFKPMGDRTFCFLTKEIQKDGSKRTLTLRRAFEVEIRRHVKIREEAHPFDPQFETYFEERLSVQMENNLQGRRRLLYLWKRQKGLCPVCGEKITKVTRWHAHHLIRRVDGGADSTTNLTLLHPLCHRRGHAKGFTFVLPVGPVGSA
jgi:RNA-directed DNA polymerase